VLRRFDATGATSMKTLLAAILTNIIITLFILSYPFLFAMDILRRYSKRTTRMYGWIMFNIAFDSRIDALLNAIRE
jgi:hypothetical protein